MTEENIKNLQLCKNCDLCCQYITAPIRKPKNKEDYSNIIWQLLHENVNVFVDHDNDWHIEFITPCSALDQKTKLCTIYESRPKICRDYKQTDCVKYNNAPAEKLYFKTAESFEKYLKDKKINYKFVYKNKK